MITFATNWKCATWWADFPASHGLGSAADEKELLLPNRQLCVVNPRPIRVALDGQLDRPGIY